MSVLLLRRGILASSFRPPVLRLLDLYPGAAAAYSFRLLRAAYSGACIRVRRSSDNAEDDFGFVVGALDVAALLSFVGAGDGFVVTWYDQSGNARHATQATTTNQPPVVLSGSLVTLNGKPALATSAHWLDADWTNTLTAQSVFAVALGDNLGNNVRLYSQSAGATADFALSGGYIPLMGHADDTINAWADSARRAGRPITDGVAFQVAALHTGAQIQNRVDGGDAATYDQELNREFTTRRIGSGANSSGPWTGRIAEIIDYSSDQSANWAAITADQAAFWGTP